MTDRNRQDEHDEVSDAPLDPWMQALLREDDDQIVVPRELMWARIRKERAVRAEAAHRQRTMGRYMMTGVAIAATLVIGIGLGRLSKPDTVEPSDVVAGADSQSVVEASPVRVAMNEHLVKTAMLLTSVVSRDPDARPRADIAAWSQELLSTTRMLLDSPEVVADDATRRLLEDLEVVLMQIIQSRGTAAPEARRAPSETMRETNLLPRVRAAVSTASVSTGEITLGGASE
jgi:hypothetical protein